MGDVAALRGPSPTRARSGGPWRALPVVALVAGSLALAMSLISATVLLMFIFGQPGPYLMPMPSVDVLMPFSSLNLALYLPMAAVGLLAGVVGLWSTSHRHLAVIGLVLTALSAGIAVPALYTAVALV